MSSPVSYALHDTVGVITIDNPPVNALSQAVRAGIVDALEQAASDSSEAVVIACAGRTFIAGADITEFGRPPQEPFLPFLLDQLEQHPKLTVAAIHGTALGGGLETALACNYRMALSSAKVGLPEVKLGLLPGAGGTQRLPRVAGAQAAITMIGSGDPVSASKALAWSVIDRVVNDDLLTEAISWAKELVASGAPQRKACDETFTLSDDDRQLIETTRQALDKKTRGEFAPQRALDCVVAAAELDFKAGLKRERELFIECMSNPQAAAMQHMFFAEREAAKVDGLDRNTPKVTIQKVGIIGAGTMGGGIAMCFAQAGMHVTLLDRDEDAVAQGIARIEKNYAISVKRGRLTDDQVSAIMGNITPATDYQALADADLVIEAVFENLAIKQDVFRTLDGICKDGAILATNTSYQDVNAIAAVTQRPEWVLGMHFFSPANVMRLLEVVRGEKSNDTVIATAMAVAKTIGKTPVLAGVCYGFIGNRMLQPYFRETSLCLIEGATPAQIDGAMERWGMAMGPLAVGDLAGLDIGYKAREQLSDAEKGNPASYLVADRLVEAGRLGQKSGAGYYRYDPETRARLDDPDVMAIVEATSAELGITRRAISDEEIVDRLTLALANEGARILEEGIAQRASDIDVVYIYGYGFPRFKGGPMHNAEARGIAEVVARINEFAETLSAENWQPSQLLLDLAASGGKLRDVKAH